MMADGERVENDVYRTLGGLEEGLKRKADASDVQMELRRLLEHTTAESRREATLVMDRIDAVRDDLRRDMNGIEEDIGKQSSRVDDAVEELQEVSGKVDTLSRDVAEMSKLVKSLADRPRTTVAEWVRWGLLAFGVLAAFVSGNWETIAHFRL